MKTRETARKVAYIGAGAGLILFLVLGLLPGSLLGGVVGLKIAGGLFGHPVGPALLPRLMVGISMLLGVLVSAVIFIAGAASAGWLVGCAAEAVSSMTKGKMPAAVR